MISDANPIHPRRHWVHLRLEQMGESAVLIDDHDAAIIGIVEDDEDDSVRVAYSLQKILQGLASMGMEPDDAQEFYDYNIAGEAEVLCVIVDDLEIA